jgi:periplasmic protein CpxP/Spy
VLYTEFTEDAQHPEFAARRFVFSSFVFSLEDAANCASGRRGSMTASVVNPKFRFQPCKSKKESSMKQIRNLFLFAVCFLAVAAFAQQGPPPQGGEGHGGPRRGMPTAEEQLAMLTERLSLTPDQQAKVKTLLEDQRAQMGPIMKNESLSREEKGAKMREIHEGFKTKVRALLTDEQKKKADAMEQEMREHQRQGPQGGERKPGGNEQPK